jgi:phosphoribosyl-ATP pyrophosphohydrolase/phosphoribosyl-AMP cyclohydrolase
MNIENLAWEKMGGMIPAIVQDFFDGRVLMQGYMNTEALETTLETGKVTFWSRSRDELWTKGETMPELAFLTKLESVIAQRDDDRPEGSYTTKLLDEGIKRIAQKVGEEGVETALAAVAGEDEELLNESADLLFHLLVLLRSRKLELGSLVEVLRQRHGV